MVFDHEGCEVARHQLEHRQHFEHPGWVEHDPEEIWENTAGVIEATLRSASLQLGDLAGIGIANQRETTVVWDRATARPVAPAIVWQDTRSADSVSRLIAEGREPFLRDRTGLPLTTYSSATKLGWLLDRVPDGRRRAAAGTLLFGTVDSWLIWRLTGRHVTDVTNASRTMLMDLETLEWDDELLEIFDVPREMLPEIGSSTRSAAELVALGLGTGRGGVPVTGILGDQQAAMLGQGCVSIGDLKNTYGTGNFLLLNTGAEIVRSTHGLISTVCYQLGDAPPSYALEGAIAVTGSAVQWLRDQLGIIQRAEDCEALAASVPNSGGLYFVPAFSGLFAPHWRADARGVIVGMSRAHTRAHIARATLEAVAYQSRDVVKAMEQDLGREITELRVDGGMTANGLCMQLQADILGIPVIRAAYPETTVRGAAFAAGLGAEFWRDVADLPVMPGSGESRWEPRWSKQERAEGLRGWEKALLRSLDWVGEL